MRLLRRSEEEEKVATAKLVVDGVGELEARVVDVNLTGTELQVIPESMAAVIGGRYTQLISADSTRSAGHLERLAAPGLVRFVRDKSSAVLREWTRVDVELDAFAILNDVPQTIRVKIKDLSAGGALLHDADELPLGRRFELVVPIEMEPDPIKLRVPSRIIRAQDGGVRAVRFMEVEPEDRKVIQQFVLAQQIRRKRADGVV